MAVNRLTGCSAIIVPRRIAHATRTTCPIRLLVALSPVRDLFTPRQTFVPRYHGGNCHHRAVKERYRTSEQDLASSQTRPSPGRGEGACADPRSSRRSGPVNCPFGCDGRRRALSLPY